MKKFICLTLFAMLCLGLWSFPAAGEETNLLSGKLTWCAKGWAHSKYPPQNATDGNTATFWNTNHHGVNSGALLYVQVAPEGEEVPYYNKVKAKIRQYNTKSISLGVSDTLTGDVPTSSGVQDPNPKLKNPQVIYEKYYDTWPGNGAQPVPSEGEIGEPMEITMTFDATNKRYLYFKNQTAYDSKNTNFYAFALYELEAYHAIPQTLAITNVKTQYDIGVTRRIYPKSGFWDEAGDLVEDSTIGEYSWSLESTGEGVTIDPSSGVMEIAAGAPAQSVTLKLQVTSGDYRGIEVSKTITLAGGEYVPEKNVINDILQNGDVHPRVLVNPTEMNRALVNISQDSMVGRWYNTIQSAADKLISLPPMTYTISSGRLLEVSRAVKTRVLNASLAYLKTGDSKYAERVWTELDAVCNFPDWNPSHFLDTAEMACAVAVGYDWLYDYWSGERKALLEKKMIEYAITPYVSAHKTREWWIKAENNWNIVCNGGILMAVLALGDKSGEIGERAIASGFDSIRVLMPKFSDGGWDEGPMYWRFTTEYMANFLSTLESSTGGYDYGFGDYPGLNQCGYFADYMTGSGGVFNYSDAMERRENPPQVFWFGKRYQDDNLIRIRKYNLQNYPLGVEVRDVIWYKPVEGSVDQLPLDKKYDSVNVASFRSEWNQTDAIFAAVKAGETGVSHGHLDLGSFVFDAWGTRYAMDLGRDTYSYTNDTESEYSLYRQRAEGHNTLVINPDSDIDQVKGAKAPITWFSSMERSAGAMVDLTEAYTEADFLQRGIQLYNRRQLVIKDEGTLNAASDVYWFMHTRAAITVAEDGKSALMNLNGNYVRADLRCGQEEAAFIVMEAKPFDTSPQIDGQTDNVGISKLTVKLTGVKTIDLTVILTPVYDPEQSVTLPPDEDLAQWTLSERPLSGNLLDDSILWSDKAVMSNPAFAADDNVNTVFESTTIESGKTGSLWIAAKSGGSYNYLRLYAKGGISQVSVYGAEELNLACPETSAALNQPPDLVNPALLGTVSVPASGRQMIELPLSQRNWPYLRVDLTMTGEEKAAIGEAELHYYGIVTGSADGRRTVTTNTDTENGSLYLAIYDQGRLVWIQKLDPGKITAVDQGRVFFWDDSDSRLTPICASVDLS